MDENCLSRAELLSGSLNRSRRAAKLLAAIEARCIYMRDESRRVVAAYLLEGNDDFRRCFDMGYLQSLKRMAASPEVLLLDHLERFAAHWKTLVPADPELRARIIRLMAQKYKASPTTSPCAFAMLGALEPEVQAAFTNLDSGPLQNADEAFPCSPETDQLSSNRAARDVWEDVEAGLQWLNLASGETLYHQGDPSDALYVVISGRMRSVTACPDSTEHLVGEMGRGELLGEVGIITGDTRSSTVRAIRDSELVRLGRNELLLLAQRHLQVMVQINALIARRLQKQYLRSGTTETGAFAFALVPCDASVPLQDFGRQLAQALSELGPTMYITCADLEDATEPGAAQAPLDDPRNAQVVAWLSELESRYRYLVYEAVPEVSEWSRRCIRQADRILLIGRTGASPLPATHVTALLATRAQAQTELVLLHSSDATSATGTAHWLRPRSVRAHHHVRLGNSQDMAHLARCLTGHALGLVLSGGGARGFGHIGALRALRAAGICVDEVGGTSMGALMAAGYAMGMDDLALKDMALHMGSRDALLDRTLPIISIYSTRKITELIRKLSGALDIEDLWLPYFCLSCNLSQGNQMVHTQGPLWLAVRASMAASPIFTPINFNGDLLVDGGFLNNLPVDVMRRRIGNGTVLGIDCSPLAPKTQQYEFGPSISGWQALRYQMTPPARRKGPPNIVGVFSQIMDTNGLYRQQFVQDEADLIVRLPARGWGMLDFEHCAEIIDVGYQATREQLAAWLPTRQKC